MHSNQARPHHDPYGHRRPGKVRVEADVLSDLERSRQEWAPPPAPLPLGAALEQTPQDADCNSAWTPTGDHCHLPPYGGGLQRDDVTWPDDGSHHQQSIPATNHHHPRLQCSSHTTQDRASFGPHGSQPHDHVHRPLIEQWTLPQYSPHSVLPSNRYTCSEPQDHLPPHSVPPLPLAAHHHHHSPYVLPPTPVRSHPPHKHHVDPYYPAHLTAPPLISCTPAQLQPTPFGGPLSPLSDGNEGHVTCAELGASGKQLIVNYLASSVSSAELHRMFSQFGPLDGARVIYDRETGVTRGFGFVYFRQRHCAAAAMAALDGMELNGKWLKITYSNNPLHIATVRRRAVNRSRGLSHATHSTRGHPATSAGQTPAQSHSQSHSHHVE
jgi:hypothetical protein